MYKLNFVPVNIGKPDACVYSTKTIFPIDLLEQTVEKLKKKDSFVSGEQDDDFIYKDNYVTLKFSEGQERWCVPDVYLAYEAYTVAAQNKFNFYPVLNENDKPRLLISKAFKKSCIVVNTLTLNAVLVNDPLIFRHVTSLLRKKVSDRYCMTLFNVLNRRDKNKSVILDALLVMRGTDDEAMIVNPALTMHSECITFYGIEDIQEFRELLNGANETERWKRVTDDFVERTDINYYLPKLSTKHISYIVNLYDKCLSKKCDYYIVSGEDYEEYFYVSTNYAYIVDAFTFTCYKIDNAHLKDTVQCFVENSTNNIAALVELHNLLEGDLNA